MRGNKIDMYSSNVQEKLEPWNKMRSRHGTVVLELAYAEKKAGLQEPRANQTKLLFFK